MMLVARADRGLLQHATESVKKGVSWLLAPRTYQRKAIAVAILMSVAYFCFATTLYQVTVSSQITPAETLNFAAPFEGTIRACYVELGDDVNQGDLLYEMGTTDLQLQRDKLESDLEVLRLRVTQALVSNDVRLAALSGAEMRVVQAQLALTRHDLAEAQVRAPSRGTIVQGELSQRIGEVVPMGAPLLEFVPKGDWLIELLVPERMAIEVQVGFEGQFACNARPGEVLNCKIVRIQPSSEPRDGKNVFIAEAIVEGNPEWMRAGMEGIAQIDAGERRVWWVALHRVIDYVHLTFWL
jgi:multidrug resistance efflux pump